VIVVDNSVLVYFWLPSEFAGVAEVAKVQDKVWAAPILWRAEFRNVLPATVRRKTLAEAEANTAYFECAERFGRESIFRRRNGSSSWCWLRTARPIDANTSRWRQDLVCRW